MMHTEQHGKLASRQNIYLPVGRSGLPFMTALGATSFLRISSGYKVRPQRNLFPLSTVYTVNTALQRILPNEWGKGSLGDKKAIIRET